MNSAFREAKSYLHSSLFTLHSSLDIRTPYQTHFRPRNEGAYRCEKPISAPLSTRKAQPRRAHARSIENNARQSFFRSNRTTPF